MSLPKDWYRKMMMGIIPISFSILMYLFCAGSGDFLFSDWYLNLIAIPGFIGAQLSGAGYLGRGVDAILPNPTAGKKERYLTLLGLIVGLALGIAIVVVSQAVPLLKPLGLLADIIFPLGCVGMFAGLGNRIGQSLDDAPRPDSEKKAILIAATLGMMAAIALVAAKCAMMVSVVGVSTFLTAGAALPLWIAGAVFVASFSSSFASSADYIAKSVSFLRQKTTTSDEVINRTLKDRSHEYRGSFAGVSTGLIVAGLIIGALVISQPYLFAGIVGVVAAMMIVSACVSVLGGLFSRVGRLIDAYQTTQDDSQEERALLLAPDYKLDPDQDRKRELSSTPLVMNTLVINPDEIKPFDDEKVTESGNLRALIVGHERFDSIASARRPVNSSHDKASIFSP